jgi:hypothetical protein
MDFGALEVVVDLNVTPEYLVFGPVYVGGLLLVTNPVLMGSVVFLDREDGCENCCSDASRGGGGRRNADSGANPCLGC